MLVDVLVIGAGVIGLACAFRLAREGQRVLLLDRNAPGLGASFGNAGHIATEQIFPLASPETVRGALRYLFDRESPLRYLFDREGPLQIRPGYLLPILPWLVRFAWAARQRSFDRGVAALSSLQHTAAADLAALLRDASATLRLKMNGHLVLVENPASVNAAKAEILRLAKFGVDSNWLPPTAVRELVPDITAPIQGAMKFSGTGHVDDPYGVCKSLFDAFLAAGGKFIQSDVSRVDASTTDITVHGTDGTPHTATNLILCCGAWSKALAAQLGYVVPLDTERGYHISLPGIVPRFDIPIASYERKIIMTPMSGGLRMTGTVEFGGLALAPDPGRFELLKRHMNALAPSISTQDATTWMGFRPSMPDHLPVLGRVPDGRKIYFAFGHQHLGLTLAGVTARIMAAEVMGRKTEIDLSPFAANRF